MKGFCVSNHLIHETSPYLLQHAANPVDWYPWGEEAFSRARREQKPVFLSIGYSTCHWCHVMAHESFEDEETARLLNENFISIKVDREERPDIDSVYMAVCQTFTGSGGWPTSIFMTPEQKPFFAGTYFPVQSQYGMIGFRDLLRAISHKWQNNRSELLESAEKMIDLLKNLVTKAGPINPALPETAVQQFRDSYDRQYGGFGSAPKFPTPHNLLFLLAYSQFREDPQALAMASTTLTQMRKGGIFDHIGYGFSRYSTDRYFLAPHFEKMLYDNALLILAYTAAYAVTKEVQHLETAEKTAAYILREMVSPEGAFYSAQDADSDGVEGKYYLFEYDEILSVLGETIGPKFNQYFGITKHGNFEGKNIPNRLHGEEVGTEYEDALSTLYEYRAKRTKLHLDDKIMTAWNALMISALSFLYRVSEKPQYLCAAKRAQQYIENHLLDGSILYVSCRSDKRSGAGFLDDYAYYTAALLNLYDATCESLYLEKAETICHEAVQRFCDGKGNGFRLNGKGNESLVLTPKETYDGALPSGNAMMAYNLVRLAQMTHKQRLEEAAAAQLAYLSGEAEKYPAGHSMFLLSLLLYLNPPPNITVVLCNPSEWDTVRPQLPLYANVTVFHGPTDEYPLLRGQTKIRPVCRRPMLCKFLLRFISKGPGLILFHLKIHERTPLGALPL